MSEESVKQKKKQKTHHHQQTNKNQILKSKKKTKQNQKKPPTPPPLAEDPREATGFKHARENKSLFIMENTTRELTKDCEIKRQSSKRECSGMTSFILIC